MTLTSCFSLTPVVYQQRDARFKVTETCMVRVYKCMKMKERHNRPVTCECKWSLFEKQQVEVFVYMTKKCVFSLIWNMHKYWLVYMTGKQ